MKPYLKICTVILALLGGTGGVYAAGEHFGFRPAYLMELRAVQSEIQVVANTVDWMRLENYERLMSRRNLTRKECADYRAVAKRLGVSPRNC